MKKASYAIAVIFTAIGIAHANPNCPPGPNGEIVTTVQNLYTGRWDCITSLSSGTLPSGSSQYILNTGSASTQTFTVGGATFTNISQEIFTGVTSEVIGSGINFTIDGTLLLNDSAGSFGQIATSSGTGFSPLWSPASLLTPVSNNTFLGIQAGNSSVSGSFNDAFGDQALQRVNSGSNNVAIGFQALALSSVAFSNTGIGSQSLNLTTTGPSNTAIGGLAGHNNSVGDHNTFLGAGADTCGNNLTNVTAIGSGAIVCGSSNVLVGNGNVVQTTINGAITLGSSAVALTNLIGNILTSSASINGLTISGQFVTITSSRPWMSSCGTSPSIASYATNYSGNFTAGTGLLSACTVNFGTPVFVNPPSCQVSSPTVISSLTVSSTVNGFIVGGTSLTGDVISFNCSASL